MNFLKANTAIRRSFIGIRPFIARPAILDPFSSLERNLKSFDQIFSDFDANVPRVNLTESENKYTVTADVPGIPKEDINISLHDSVLHISGSRVEENSDETKHIYERVYGSFSRKIRLPNDATGQIKGKVDHGVLKVEIEKSLDSGKKIEIE